MSAVKNPFVKAATTTTQVSTSRAELEKMLRRYGAAGFSVAHDYSEYRVVISLVLPDRPGKGQPKIPVKLPVNIRFVYDAMFGRPTKYDYNEKKYVYNPTGYDTKKLEQAERVAWRNLTLWVDAALSAATIGLQSIAEAFFAHAIVGAEGERMIDLVEAHQTALGSGVQRLLTSEAES